MGKVKIPSFPQRSTIFAADGTVLAEIFLDENRRTVKIRKVNEVARNAVVAIEDAEFYEHGALDFTGLLRAAITNLAAGEVEQGGSTISQQLVKNVLIELPEQTFARKFQEAALAIRLERRYTKDEILELYLNEVYFGNGAYGIETAAEIYFGTTAKELTLAQAALLAGTIRAPGLYDPVANQRSRSRAGTWSWTGWPSSAWPIPRRSPEGQGFEDQAPAQHRPGRGRGPAVLRALHPQPHLGERDGRVRRVRRDAQAPRPHALPGRTEHLHVPRPGVAGLRAGGGRREPLHRRQEEQPRRRARVGAGDRRRDQGDALGQELRARPVRPRVARDAADRVRPSSRSRWWPRSRTTSRKGRCTRRSRRSATSRHGSARAAA